MTARQALARNPVIHDPVLTVVDRPATHRA